MPKAVTDQDFQSAILDLKGVSLVDFWATWCGPCRMLAPIVEELASDYEGKAQIAKLDVDATYTAPARSDEHSTLIIFKDGQEVDACGIHAQGRIVPYLMRID